jgi:plastocyanin
MARTRRLIAALAAITFLAAGCGDDDDASTATTEDDGGGSTDSTDGGGGGGGSEMTIVAQDYAFVEAPDEVEAGAIELSFTNDGKVPHEVAFVPLGDGGLDAVIADFPGVLEGGPFPDYAESVAVPADIGPGEEVTTTFLLTEPGDYAMFCALDGVAPEGGEAIPEGEEPESGDLHLTLGMIQPITVTDGAGSAELPETDGAITASDYTFEVDVAAGSQSVAFTNDGPDQVHHGVFFAFVQGTDETAAAAALDAFLQSDEGAEPPPELDFRASDGLPIGGVFSAGLGQTIDFNFEAGRTYAVLCFIQDRAGGPPHAIAHDMKKIFTVSG